MKILSIDTSSDVCSVAILEDMRLINELNIVDSKTHSENLMPLVDQIFTTSSLSLPDMDMIVINIGPGSFTGIRIGVSTVKALAEVTKVPVIAVSSLDGISFNETHSGIICSLIDCRNNNTYCGLYNSNHILQEEYLAEYIDDTISILSKYDDILFIGTGAVLHKELLKEKLQDKKIFFSEKNVQSAFSLGKCGYTKYIAGIKQSADSVNPMYLRKSQAERLKKKDE